MAENYKHLYEQTKKMLAMYQDELVPGFRKKIEELEQKSKWISVEDELPKEQGFYRVYHKNSKSICDRFYYKDCPDLFVNVQDDPITHWKPMEQPPKGEH